MQKCSLTFESNAWLQDLLGEPEGIDDYSDLKIVENKYEAKMIFAVLYDADESIDYDVFAEDVTESFGLDFDWVKQCAETSVAADGAKKVSFTFKLSDVLRSYIDSSDEGYVSEGEMYHDEGSVIQPGSYSPQHFPEIEDDLSGILSHHYQGEILV
jgi:hypothetical protein